MTGEKSQTKLLKMVCKRAGLMRAPFHGSSWPSKISQTHKKKSLSVQTTDEKHRSNVVKSNAKKICSSVQKVCNIETYILYLRILFN